jgi:nucleoside-diphosphate-sugar epimerase
MKRLVIVGGTGMVGGYALRYALEQPAVGRVTVIGRRMLDISHPKLTEVLHRDFADCHELRIVRHISGSGLRENKMENEFDPRKMKNIAWVVFAVRIPPGQAAIVFASL